MAWVKAENARTVAVLEHDPHYAALFADAARLAKAHDRIPYPATIGGQFYNFWQDAEHPHGIWRRTSPESYRFATPSWTTVLDLDALSKSEKGNWFWQGARCAEPAEQRCLVRLSDGGEDAATVREFDLKSGAFVKGGFQLSHGKQSVEWEDSNTVLVAREWKPGEMTKSGYPFVVKRLRRGQALADAVEVFRGAATDVEVNPSVLDDGDRNHAVVVARSPSFFETDHFIKTAKGFEKLAMPRKANLVALVAGQLVIQLDTVWTPRKGSVFAAGSLVSVPLDAAESSPAQLSPTLIVTPGPREAINELAATRNALLVTQLDNVRGRAVVYTPGRRGVWTRTSIAVPDNLTIGIEGANIHSDIALLVETGFLTPNSVWVLNVRSRAPAQVKSLPAKFDAARDTVEQFEAVSRDGTRVPYFVVRPRGMKRDGTTPRSSRPTADSRSPIRRYTHPTWASCGWSRAGRGCWRTFAVAGNSGRRGMRRD